MLPWIKSASRNPRSVLFNGILGIEELDMVSEDFWQPALRCDLNQFRLVASLRTAGAPPRRPTFAAAQTIDERANADRTTYKVSDSERTGDLDGANPVQAAAGGTSAF